MVPEPWWSFIWRAKANQGFKPFQVPSYVILLNIVYFFIVGGEAMPWPMSKDQRKTCFSTLIDHVDPGDLSTKLRLGSKRLHPLGYLPGPALHQDFVVSCCYGLNRKCPSQTHLFEPLDSGSVVLLWETVESLDMGLSWQT